MSERFRVTSVTGYGPGVPSAAARPATLYQVLDSAYCFRIVKEFRPMGSKGSGCVRDPQAAALQLAAALNAETLRESADLEPLPTVSLADELHRRASAGDRAA